MFETVPYSRKLNSATPDRIFIPEWNIGCKFYMEEGVTWTYYHNLLYAGKRPLIHPSIYTAYNFKDMGFDGRLWTDFKLFTFWWCCDCGFGKKEIITWTKEIAEKFRNGDFVLPKVARLKTDLPDTVDITEYTFMFNGIVDGAEKVIKCDYDTFIKGEFEIYDHKKLRFFRQKDIELGEKILYGESKEKSQYQLSCEYWDRKIGSMDVAEWHLLMYEE